MSSWYSWFTGLPMFDFTVPSSIQRRFFSFLLRRTLGHFLKPGQLDLHQIDSQLGSGTIQVKDLELDGQAINQLLVGLPFTLYDGFISGVTARIPFPNPLSSTVGCHIQSLHLTFHMMPEQPISSSMSFHNSSNLADSVASVAGTFIHDELSPREEATLRQTLRSSDSSLPLGDESENLPGGFYPSGSSSQPKEMRKESYGDDDPAGVSVFATLIERLLSRFEFSAVDIKITIVCPGQASFTLSISEIVYRTDPNLLSESSSGVQPTSEGTSRCGQIRTVSISGFKLTSRDLCAVASPIATNTSSPVLFPVSRTSSPPRGNSLVGQLSRSSSSSSLDEDTQLMMSQSIALLPPYSHRLPSASSSIYQSIISSKDAHPAEVDITSPKVASNTDSVGRASPRPRLSFPCRDSVEDVLLSFGSQPIVFSLKTPSRLTQLPGKVLQTDVGRPANPEDSIWSKPEQETHQLSVTVGILACALRSRHLRVLLDIVDACVSRLPSRSPVLRKETPSEPPRATLFLEVNVVIRAISIIALPESPTGSLDTFYERPFVPPRLPYTYLRLFLDNPSVSFRLSTPTPVLSRAGTLQTSSALMDESTFAKIVVADISLFTFHGVSSLDDLHVAAPILITDHYLPTLHVAQHSRPPPTSEKPQDIKLPVFEVIDWTQDKFKGGSAKLSTWRLKNRAVSGKTDKLQTTSQRPSGLSSPPNRSPFSDLEDNLSVPPAIEASGRLVPPFSSKEDLWTAEVRMAPIHLFFDLGTIFRDDLLRRFVDDIALAAIFVPSKATDLAESRILHQQGLEQLGDMDVENPRTSLDVRRREVERNRFEALVLEDLDLGMDNQHTEVSKSRSFRRHPASLQRKRNTPSESSYSLRLACPMVRVEVRCPSPSPRPLRSGCMVLDFRGVTISNDLPSTEPSLRFSEGAKPPPPRSSENVILSVCLQEALVAYSLVGSNMAHTILALGCLPTKEAGPDTSTLLAAEIITDSHPLSITLGRPNIAKGSKGNPASKMSVIVNIPLVNLVMEKAVFDGLQFWADDVAQLIEQSLTYLDRTETLPSHNPSLIGSRYFTQMRHSGAYSTDEGSEEKLGRQNTGAAIVKLSVSEVLLRFIVPRSGDSQHARPFDISVLGVSAVLELNTEGKAENMITAEVMDLHIADTSNEGDYVLLLRGPARSLSLVPKPSVRCRITSFVEPETTAKETRIRLSLWGFTVHPPLDGCFTNDLASFVRAPPGVFESVIPSECTRLIVGVVDVSIHVRPLGHPGAAALHLQEAEFSTELAGNSSEAAFGSNIVSAHFFLVDSIQDALGSAGTTQGSLGRGVGYWKNSGYALVAEISNSRFTFQVNKSYLPPNTNVLIERIGLQIHLCADTMSALTGLISSITRTTKGDAAVPASRGTSGMQNTAAGSRERDMTASLDEHAFRLIPEVGSTADMISDDLPANQDYLDASFGTAAGLRELRDDDLEDFSTEERTGSDALVMGQIGIISNIGGETVRILKPLSFDEHHFNTISPDTARDPVSDTALRVRIRDSDIVLFLHDGFDWPRTRKIIEKEVKEMRKRLARIRQLVSTGQMQDPIDETTSTTLFNSFHIGLERDLESMDPDTLIAAIDDELDDPIETGTESSWQSLHPASPGPPQTASTRMHGKRLTRSKGPSIEIRLEGLNAEIDNYGPDDTLVSRTLILVRDLEILDHIKTSTWKKFLTDMRSDSRGNVRETDSNMARVELLSVRPSLHTTEEARLRAKILPLRLYVDQDALDFFKKFFAFQDSDNPSTPDNGEKEEIYFQHAEVFPVDIKLDYKPRRVDYKALRDGRTIELMNFFHFDGAEMTLRHLTLHGITGWPRFFDTLNDLWTPDVKATQLVDVISGVAPIRSVVNVGSGVADLVLLPIAQYKKDGRIVRGLQKGTKAFVQSTAMEAIKLGTRLATGTQVILEQAENVLGGQFQDSVTAEALQIPYEDEDAEGSDEDLISRYAAQPAGLKEGVQSAYRSLRRNLHSAAQTILAVPMEVYERSGNEGAVRAVVRAVPIAVLKPMIGASEAVSKTLMGLHNTLDPNIRLENEAKYKHR